MKFICPSESGIFLCNNPNEIQLLTRLRLGLSHLQDIKFNHNFQDTLNPICNCGEDIETSCHYLLHSSLYTNERLAFLNVIQHIDNRILEIDDSHIVEVLLYGRKFLDISTNTNILNTTIDFLFVVFMCKYVNMLIKKKKNRTPFFILRKLPVTTT